MEEALFNMIEQQIRPWNVNNSDILKLFRTVKRENFVPQEHQNLAFTDFEIPLPGGQFMLSPKVEARILQELAVKDSESVLEDSKSVLEIGTGTGFMAALLAHCAKDAQVISVEILPQLADQARKNLSANGVTNVEVITGDGALGWPTRAPYDAIMVSGGLPMLPASLLSQLKIGGRLAAFVGTEPVMKAQIVTRVGEDEYRSVAFFETYVQPLLNAQQPTSSFTSV